MAITKSVLKIVPGLQATALVGHNIKFAKKSFSPKMKPMKFTKNMTRMAVGNLIGVGLIKPTSEAINLLDD